jgi:hypothetical protein
MKRVFLLFAIAALALPATALGKGPSGASIDGPGTGGGITFGGEGQSAGNMLGNLTELAGFFPAAFGEERDLLASRPKGDLGPKYTITYAVPTGGGSTAVITQDMYPYAARGAVTYMEGGQKLLAQETRGGWFQADSRLKETLVSAGLPARPVASSSDTTSFSTTLVGSTAVALFLVAATAVFLRRRTRPRRQADLLTVP